MQLLSQPSPLTVFPSSQPSPWVTMPLPQPVGVQLASQPSPLTVLPSSQPSPGSSRPLPQIAPQLGAAAHAGSAQSASPLPSSSPAWLQSSTGGSGLRSGFSPHAPATRTIASMAARHSD